jgi:GNAT superfamily N-acetyltransferase
MELTFKKLSTIKFEEAHVLFNRGFEGYLIPMNLTLDQFIGRFGNDVLSPNLSVIAFDGNDPIGFVLQGIREETGQIISWNGGTGIIPEYRGKQVGEKLVREAEKLLRENNVTTATLEALTENAPAIRLYEKCGYQVTDRLLFLSGKGRLVEKLPELGNYIIEKFPAFQAIGSEIFPVIVPWQTAASTVPKVGGEVVVLKKEGTIKAACLIRKKAVYGKEAEGITLFQVTANEKQEEVDLLLAHALEYNKDLGRSTYNFVYNDGVVVKSLLASGFEETAISQVFMTKKYK